MVWGSYMFEYYTNALHASIYVILNYCYILKPKSMILILRNVGDGFDKI